MKAWETVKKGDYLYAKVKGHPNATKNNYVLEHRYVVELHLNRYLTDKEVVHHINGNKKDNRLENLEVMSQKEHASLHAKKGRAEKEVSCKNCGAVFTRELRQIKYKHTFCSRSCNAKYYHKIRRNPTE